MIFAKDEFNKVVGTCKFRIVMNYARELTEAQRQIYAKNRKIKIEEVPQRAIVQIDQQKVDSYTRGDDGIKIGNNIYTLLGSYCELNNIEITDGNYHRVGLGSEMLRFVTDFADKYACERIDAFVHPYGEFKFSTIEFYKRHGFEVDKNNNATKRLSAVSNAADMMER